MWDEVASDSGNCLGRKCPKYNECFYYHARRRVQNAQILVVNHALFFSDLALRRQGRSILPEYDVVIFDEAHTLEAVAGDHLGLGVTSGQVEFMLNKLYNDRTNKGLLVHHRHGARPSSRSTRAAYAGDEFFERRAPVAATSSRMRNGRVLRAGRSFANRAQRRAERIWPRLLRAARRTTLKDESERQDLAAGARSAAGAGAASSRQWRPAACRRPSTGSRSVVAPRPAAGRRWPRRRSTSARRCASSCSARSRR